MASKKTAKTTPAEQTQSFPTLADVVAATKDSRGFLYTPASFHAKLASLETPLVELNNEMVNEAGEIATRATAAGIAQIEGETMTQETSTVDAGSNTEAQPTAQATASNGFKFEVEKVAIPQKVRKVGDTSNLNAGRKPMYPFEILEVNDSFFVPNSNFDKAGKPGDAFKSLGSVIATARTRFAEEIPGETRVMRGGKTVPATRQLRDFDMVRDEKQTPSGVVQGVRVWRKS